MLGRSRNNPLSDYGFELIICIVITPKEAAEV